MHRSRQSGFMLILIMLVVMVTGTTVLLAAQLRDASDPVAGAAEAAHDLKAARSALVVYAVRGGVDGNPSTGRPGTLPCPDTSTPGTPGYGEVPVGNNCSGSDVFVGRVPWKTLDLEPAEEPLWLAIDANFVNHSNSEPVNPSEPDLDGALELNGESGFAAVVLAPGLPLAGQTDRPASDVEEYLEGYNVESGPSPRFEHCGGDGGDSRLGQPCNDRALGLTAAALLEMAGRRVLAETEEILRDYYDGVGSSTLPHAAAAGSAPELPCEDGLPEGGLPLTAGDPATGGCGGSEFLDVCAMDRWIRPEDLVGELDCGPGVEGGNDWLRLITYSIDLACTQPGQPCTAHLGFVDHFGIDAYIDLRREVSFGTTGGGS